MVAVKNNNLYTFYVNGTVDATLNFTQTVSATNGITLGKNVWGGGEYFNGSMDDVRIYNRALSSAEVQSLWGGSGQTITFGAITSQPFNGGTATVSATSTSGLPVTFTTLTSAVCTVSGSTLTPVSVGTCTIAANQAGNTNYGAATQVTRNISIVPLCKWVSSSGTWSSVCTLTTR